MPSPEDLQQKFLTIAAHDLRGSLGNIRSFVAYLLGKAGDGDPRLTRGLEIVLRNAERALALTRDVFDALREDLRPLALETFCEVVPLARRAAERAVPVAAERKVHLEVDIPETLPPAAFDPVRLERGLEALLVHALEHAAEGTAVALSVHPEDGALAVTLLGAHPAEPLGDEVLLGKRGRIAEERRLDPALALWLLGTAIERQGGQLTVDSVEGRARYRLRLPQAPVASVAGSPPAR